MRFRIAAVALGATALLLTPSAGAREISAPIHVDRSGTIVGAETTIGSVQAATVRLKLLSPPGADGTRRLWDRCVLPYGGPGQYRCEFDVGSATARQRRGEWLARLRLDDHTVARKVFYLP